MKNIVIRVIWVLIMAALIIAVDVLFFEHHFWQRLVANIVIVVLGGLTYVKFGKRL